MNSIRGMAPLPWAPMLAVHRPALQHRRRDLHAERRQHRAAGEPAVGRGLPLRLHLLPIRESVGTLPVGTLPVGTLPFWQVFSSAERTRATQGMGGDSDEAGGGGGGGGVLTEVGPAGLLGRGAPQCSQRGRL